MKVIVRVISAALAVVSGSCFGQTANAWYPADYLAQYHVKHAAYDLRTFGSLSRIELQFVENGLFLFYYFSPTDSVQLQKAGAIYASLITASSAGSPVSVYVTGPDAYSSGWDFLSIQVGPN